MCKHVVTAWPKKRLLIVCMNYAPELAGCGKYTGEIGADMTRRGHAVSVVTTPAHYPEWRVLPPHANIYSSEMLDGVHIFRCPLFLRSEMRGIWRLIAPATFALTSAPVVLWRALIERPHTIVLVEPTLLAAPATLLASWLVGARSVLHVQDLEVNAAFAVGHLKSIGFLKHLAMAFERVCMRGFDRIITIGQVMAERIAEKAQVQAPITVIRNWVFLDRKGSPDAREAYRAEFRLPTDAFAALYSGSIGPKHGLDVVIEAARLLRERTDLVFVVAGEGPSKAALREAAMDLQNVHFLPFQPAERLGDFLCACDMHLLPQQAGVGDLVVPSKLGAMLVSGRPIVVTTEKDTELARFVDGVATIIPPADARALAEAIERVTAGNVRDLAAGQAALAVTLSHEEAFKRYEAVLFGPGVDPTVVSLGWRKAKSRMADEARSRSRWCRGDRGRNRSVSIGVEIGV